MKIAILGYGAEGQAAYEYWSSPDNQLTVCDKNENLELPAGANKQLGDNYLKGLEGFDLIVRSPGILPDDISAANSPAILEKVTSNCNEFFRVSPTKHSIGVTGTKGKGTTTTLIAKMLEAAGKTVHLGGNIGLPALSLLKQNITPDDYVVLELSSFQLADLHYSPSIAVCLMVAPEHLNWHSDMEDYVSAKSNLFARQSSSDIAIYLASNETSTKIAAAGAGKKVPYFAIPGAYVENEHIVMADQTICSVNDIKLIGKHNWENVCAAITAVWQVTQDVNAIKQVVTTFSGLEHRLERLRDVAGVTYYNDSFAATPDAAIAAIEAIPGMKVMIMGGFDRGLPLKHVAAAVKANEEQLRSILLIGASAKRLAGEFDEAGFSNYEISTVPTMSEIVAAAQAAAQHGDSVVLSPGFASFDMFRNFEDRGQQFKESVERL